MPKLVNKEEKKQNILLAALKVFSKKGYYNTKIIEVAREAGIGKGTVYEYFSSKEQLFGESFTFLFTQLESELMSIINNSGSPTEKILRLIDVSFGEFTRYGEGFLEVMMDFWAEGIRNKSRKHDDFINLHDIYQEYRQLIATLIEEGIASGEFKKVNSNAEASILMAIMDGLMLQWMMDKEAFTLKEAVQFIKDHVILTLHN